MKTQLTRPIWVIGKSSYKEIIRDRLLYGILLIAFLVITSSFFLGTISLQQDNRVIQNIGLAAIHLFTVFICIFVTSNSLYRDLDRRALYLLLPKPISRTQYLLGKYVGMLFLLITTLLILGGLFMAGLAFVAPALLVHALIILAYSFLEISLLIGIAMVFASFTAPLNASLYTTAFFIIGHSITFVREYLTFNGGAFERRLIDLVYYTFPNLSKFDVRQALLYDITPSASQISFTLAYWAIYLGLALFLATAIMKKREV